MLVLDGGDAMGYLVTELEDLGYRWAYRLVDSRFTGVPQRRQRVILVAARDLDVRAVLFANDAGEPAKDDFSDDACGFYWTEGLRGLGWARDAVPTLKGGSTIGIPSPPAIWHRQGEPGQRIVVPGIHDAERLQGFPVGWTQPADSVSGRAGVRWKLLGNAVTVGVSEWIGRRLRDPGEPLLAGRRLDGTTRWPTAAYGAKGKAWAVDVSMWPTRAPYQHLSTLLDLDACLPLSARAASGFLSRARKGNLRFTEGFLEDVAHHARWMSRERTVA
jgi:DNA (cytosine-5)-methyltransferase 1